MFVRNRGGGSHPVTTITTPITTGGGGGEEGASAVVVWEPGVEQGLGLRQALINKYFKQSVPELADRGSMTKPRGTVKVIEDNCFDEKESPAILTHTGEEAALLQGEDPGGPASVTPHVMMM